jgi:hypothetical protein
VGRASGRRRAGGARADGGGVIAVGAFYGRRMSAQAGTKVRTHAFVDEPTLVVGELLRLVHQILGQLPDRVAGDLVDAPVTFIGGAQQSRPLLELICYRLHLDITAADRPETAVVSGLAHEVSGNVPITRSTKPRYLTLDCQERRNAECLWQARIDHAEGTDARQDDAVALSSRRAQSQCCFARTVVPGEAPARGCSCRAAATSASEVRAAEGVWASW